ncbi:MAG: lysophospholipid acyltransferase family protein [Bryobacteraceae bacterium]
MPIFSRLRALLITDPLIVLATTVLGTISLATSLFDGTGHLQHRVAQIWARILLKVSGVQVTVEGLERIQPGQSYVFVANHRSFMDIPIVLAHIPVQFRFLAKRSILKIPFIGYHLHRAGHIPVDRGDTRASLRAMTEVARIIRENNVSVLIFPEGGRTPGPMREFRPGAAYVAIKGGITVVPVGLCGAREILPMGALLVRGGAVRLRIGEPISTLGMDPHDHRVLTAQLQEQVAALTGVPPIFSS